MGISCLHCENCDCKTILKPFSDFAYDYCFKHASYVCSLGTNLNELEKCLGYLKLLMNNVMDLVRQAEDKGKQRTREVEEWFMKVATQRADARRLKEGGTQEYNKLPCTMECLPIYIVGKKIVDIMKDLSELKTEGEGYKTKKEEVATSYRWFPEPNLRGEGVPTFTMVGDLEAIKKKVFGYLDGGEWIVGVYGQGGVGKTTLIRLIKDHYAGTGDFLVIHVPVRDLTVEKIQVPVRDLTVEHIQVPVRDLTVEHIQEAIRAEIRLLNDWRHESVEDRAGYISHKLQQQRKFVLLLDDIREEFNVENIIGVADPHRLKGSKVVFTTRNKKVSRNMAQKMVRVETLKGPDDRKLFEEAARLNMTSMTKSKQRSAAAVVNLCAGLPLALVKLGEDLVEKTENEWEDMTSFLHNPAQHNDQAKSLFEKMMYSYDNLEGADYKACFLYCAFFPVGSYIRKYELEELWIYGDCSIHFNDFKKDPRDHARKIIGTLVDEGLLEETKEEEVVKMHNVVRCMALWLARNDTLVMAGKERTDYKKALAGSQRMKRVLSIRSKFEKLDEVPKDSCRDLTTLFVTYNKASPCKISDHFFTVMRMLTVLNLSNSEVEQLPTSISRLGSLKYLDISFTKVTKFPQLTNLYYLNVNGLNLEFDISKRVISTMSCLQVLRMLCRYGYVNKKKKKKKKKPSSRVGEEEDALVEELKSLKRLDVLEIQVGSSSTHQKLFHNSNSKVLEKMRCLSIKEFREEVCFIYLTDHTRKLVELLFTGCVFQKLSIIIEPEDTTFNKITKVTVEDCHYLLDLTCLVSLWRLKVLKVSGCSGLREIISREKLQGLVGEVEGDDQQDLFHDLAELHLQKLPELEFIYQCRYTGDLPESELKCPKSLPSKFLRELHVNSCQKLKKLPFRANSSRDDEAKQIQLHAPQTWWDAIDWEHNNNDIANPPLLRHHFRFHPLKPTR